MKNFKKIILLILITITFVTGMSNIKAIKVTYYANAQIADENGYLTNGKNTHTYKFYEYDFRDDKGNNYMGYCNDPTKNDYANLNTTVNAEKIDPDESAYYAGLYTILVNGAKIGGSSSEKIGTDIALRSFIQGIAFKGRSEYAFTVSKEYYQARFSAYTNFAIDFVGKSSNYLNIVKNLILKDKNLKKDVSSECSEKFTKECLKNFAETRYKDYQNDYHFDTTKLNSTSVNMANKLLKAALSAVDDFYKRDTNNDGKITEKDKLKAEIKEYKKLTTDDAKYFEIKFTNKNTNSKADNFKVTCANCATNNIKISKIEYQISDKIGTWKTLDAKVNLAKESNKSGYIYVRVIFDRSSLNKKNCNDVDYNISFDLYTSERNSTYSAYIINGSSNLQSFSGVVNDGDSSDDFLVGPNDEIKAKDFTNVTVKFSIAPLCSPTCEAIKDKDGKVVGYYDHLGEEIKPWNSDDFEKACGCYKLGDGDADKDAILNSKGAKYRLTTVNSKNFGKSLHNDITDNYTANRYSNKEADYRKECLNQHICEKVDNDYYGPNGEKLNNEKEYLDKCCDNPDIPNNPPECPKPHVCEIVDDKHYCDNGEECTPEEYEKRCLNLCDTSLKIPDCVEENQVSNDTVGKVEALKKDKNGKENIKSCVIEKGIDSAGNSYEASSNRYCTAYCKEDYDLIQLQSRLRNVKCGGYIPKLTAKISGSQDCYVASNETENKTINYDLFKQDLDNYTKQGQDNFKFYQNAVVKEYYHCDGSTTAYSEEIDCETGNVGADGKPETKKAEKHYGIYYNDAYYKETVNGVLKDYSGYTDKAAADKVLDNLKNNALKAMKAASDNIDTATRAIDACANGSILDSQEFTFGQKLYWKYEESYDELLNDKEKRQMDAIDPEYKNHINKEDIYYCANDNNSKLNDSFDCDNGKWSDIANIKILGYPFVTCDKDVCVTDVFEVKSVAYVYKRYEKSQDYESKDDIFYQVVGSGPSSGYITTQKYTYNDRNKFDTIPVKGLPIDFDYALDDKEGNNIAHNFTIWIEDLGEYYGTNGKQLGRILDYDANGEIDDKSIVGSKVKDGIYDNNGKYSCSYLTDCTECPTCNYECEGEYCEYVNNCPTCNYECINCIYSLGDLRLYFKPVSTTNFNSAERTYGYNWDIITNLDELSLEKKNQLEDVQAKAESVISEITASNADLYSDDNLDARFPLNSADIAWLKQYNSDNQDEGGYNNLSLESYDIGGYTGSFSTCIDELIERQKNRNTEDQIEIKDRPTPSQRNNLELVKKYFPSYQGYNADSINIGGAYK